MIEQIYVVSAIVKPRTIASVHMMLDEEIGELARAINRPWRCDEPAIAEVADVINCLADLLWLMRGVLVRDTNMSNLFDLLKQRPPVGIDPYDQLQVVKNYSNQFAIGRANGVNYRAIESAICECAVLACVLHPELSIDDVQNKLCELITKKCAKWEAQCK